MDIELLKRYDILIKCLKKDKNEPEAVSVSSLSIQDWSNLLALADMQRITPLLWHRLKQKKMETVVPEEPATMLREAFRRNTMNNLRLTGELSRLLAALKKKNIPLIPLKGIVVANTIYKNIGLREMNDIDVLAKPDDLQRIADIITNMGYQPIQSYSLNTIRQTKHHLPRFIKKNTAHFEIHWNITKPGTKQSIDPQGLWQRALPVQIAGHETLSLSNEDMLLYLCLHTSYHHPFTFGLRPFCDIAETIDHFGSALDWQTVAERANSQKWQRGTYLALRLAVDIAGASVPRDILKFLKPADMTNTILKTVRAQIFTDKYFSTSIPRPFAELLESRRLIDKMKIFYKRVFLPRALISKLYSIPIDSTIIYLFYLRRFFDVLRRHGCTLKKYQQKDDAVKSLAERTNIIADWIG